MLLKDNRVLITFLIINREENLISKMVVDGIQSMIDILSAKNVYTNYDIITIKYDKDTSDLNLDETKEFLVTPNISKVMHSSFLEFTKGKEGEKLSEEMWKKSYNLVTGGARGIGGAASKTMAEEGNNIIFTGRKLNKTVEDYANSLKSDFNVNAKFLELDIGDPTSIKSFVNYLKENQIYIKSVIHNAAVGSSTSKEQTNNEKDANDVLINVNSVGTLLLQEELEKSGMLLNPCRILIVNSVGGVRPFKEFNPVDLASKAVLNKLADALSLNSNLSVVSVFPGATNTDMF